MCASVCVVREGTVRACTEHCVLQTAKVEERKQKIKEARQEKAAQKKKEEEKKRRRKEQREKRKREKEAAAAEGKTETEGGKEGGEPPEKKVKKEGKKEEEEGEKKKKKATDKAKMDKDLQKKLEKIKGMVEKKKEEEREREKEKKRMEKEKEKGTPRVSWPMQAYCYVLSLRVRVTDCVSAVLVPSVFPVLCFYVHVCMRVRVRVVCAYGVCVTEEAKKYPIEDLDLPSIAPDHLPQCSVPLRTRRVDANESLSDMLMVWEFMNTFRCAHKCVCVFARNCERERVRVS